MSRRELHKGPKGHSAVASRDSRNQTATSVPTWGVSPLACGLGEEKWDVILRGQKKGKEATGVGSEGLAHSDVHPSEYLLPKEV